MANCPERDGWIAEVVEAHKAINILHAKEMQAVVGGDFSHDAALHTALEEARRIRDQLLRGLRDHIASHHC